MLTNAKIIAISGLKNSGKDTAADMLQYLLNSPKFMQNYWCFKHLRFLKRHGNIYKIKSFAYPLKKMLSALLGVPMCKFNDREFKEHYYISFPELKIYKERYVPKTKILSDNKFSKMAKNLDPTITDYFLSIRQLMQFFGTNVMRTYFGDGLWTYATLNFGNTIISDLRFQIEMKIVKQNKGKVIYIQRDCCVPGQHASEQEVIEMKEKGRYDYIVDNNGTLKDLFYKLKELL